MITIGSGGFSAPPRCEFLVRLLGDARLLKRGGILMLDFTPQEKRVVLFVLGLAFCGLILSNLIKANGRIEKIVNPQIQLAKLNLNKVSLDELKGLKCVSLKLARRILEYRVLHREFASLEELKEVKGVGDRRYEKLKEIFFIE